MRRGHTSELLWALAWSSVAGPCPSRDTAACGKASLLDLLAGASAEPDLLGELTALLGVVLRDHGIVWPKAPLLAVLVRGHVVGGLQMTLEHLQLFAVFQADQVIGMYRLLDRHGRNRALFLLFGGRAHLGQHLVNFADQSRHI